MSVFVASALFLTAIPVEAQDRPIEITLNPRIGLYEPLTDLGEAVEEGETVVAEQAGSLALGLGLEIGLQALPVDLRLNLDYATGSELSAAGVTEGEETTVLALVGDVIVRPFPKLVVAQPYFFAGGGFKQYDFDPDNPAGFADQADPTIHVGGGLEVALGPLGLNAEVGDYISWFEFQPEADSEIQHDLFVTVGFSMGLL